MHHYAGVYYVWLVNELRRATTSNSCYIKLKKKNYICRLILKLQTPGNWFLVSYKDCASHQILISVQA